MIRQKPDSSITPKRRSQKPTRCKTISHHYNHVLIIFFTYFTVFFLQASGLQDPYRPHRPGPIHHKHWALPFTILPLNQTANATSAVTENTTDSYTATADIEETSTETLSPEENYDIICDDDENIDEEDTPSGVTEAKKENQVIMIRPSTATPKVTAVDVPEYVTTEALIKTTRAPKTPTEELNQMLEGLDNLLSNESAVVTVDNVANTFDQLDVLLDTEELEFPCTMLHALDALGARADLNGSPAVATARHNVAVVMADSAPARPVRGLRIAASDDGFSDEGFEIFHGDVDTNLLSSDSSEAVVNLPLSLSETSRRISFVVFRSDRAFVRHDRHDQYVVNSRVISVNAENFTEMNEGEVIDIHFKSSIHGVARNMTRACAYWHFAENGTGHWSQEGCTFIPSASGLLNTCRCTHLTHFAEVLVPKAVFSEANEKALEIISLTGCFLSLFGLIVIGLTAIVFQSWRRDFNNKIWIQLAFALLINVTCFLIIVFSRFQEYNMFCFFVGVLLHYSVLASFCWMLVAAIISYRKLVLIFTRDPARKLLKASAFSWFFPLTIVTVLVAVSPESYVKRFEDKVPSAAFCYPSGLALWLSVYTPIAIIVLTNWILFAFIIRSVFAKRKIQKHGDSSELFRRASVSCLLVFLFGLPWIFGLFAKNIVAAYLFTLTTSSQGFVLFIFFVIINTKTRNLWLNTLHMKKKTKEPVSSSLLTNRSEPVRDESEQQAFIEPTSTRTNVTSLMSNTSSGRAAEFNASRSSAVLEDTNSFHRYESEGSFVTAKSFNDLLEQENDDNQERYDENFLAMVIRKVVEEEELKNKSGADESRTSLSENSDDHNIKIGELKNEETTNLGNSNNNDLEAEPTSKRFSIEIKADNENNSVHGSNVDSHVADTTSSHRTSDDKVDDQRDTNHSSQNQGKDNDQNGPEIKVYNVPVQNASLIS